MPTSFEIVFLEEVGVREGRRMVSYWQVQIIECAVPQWNLWLRSHPDDYRHAELQQVAIPACSAQALTYVWTRIPGRRNPIVVARCMNPPRSYNNFFMPAQTLRHSPSLLAPGPFERTTKSRKSHGALTVPNNPKAEMTLQSTVVYWLRVMHQCDLDVFDSRRALVLELVTNGAARLNMTFFLGIDILPVPLACFFPETVLMDVQAEVLFPSTLDSASHLARRRCLRITARSIEKGAAGGTRIACLLAYATTKSDALAGYYNYPHSLVELYTVPDLPLYKRNYAKPVAVLGIPLPSSMFWLGPKSADRRAGPSSMELAQRVHGALMEPLDLDADCTDDTPRDEEPDFYYIPTDNFLLIIALAVSPSSWWQFTACHYPHSLLQHTWQRSIQITTTSSQLGSLEEMARSMYMAAFHLAPSESAFLLRTRHSETEPKDNEINVCWIKQ
ncbi:hypothetical protein ARMGADRAFT_1022711 [Armillaria gallica]|uniref:Uncharacterized protein n=1 Tax=Armillaria gallica TaxID=47427 RepID=A0A2H3EA11_ARMGA|nr:hypothetical protein ARMGADRAFT_1022711 [Armillaria gallica]